MAALVESPLLYQFLFEPAVSKAEDVVPHHKLKCSYKSCRVVMFPVMLVVE